MSEQSEIEEIVSRANAEAGEEAGEEEDSEESDSAPKKPRRRTSRAKPRAPKPVPTMEELEREEQAELLLDRPLPKPEKEVKGLDDMYAKFGVGEHPDFKVQVWRTYPKLAPGGRKFDGFYDTWDTPIGMEQIQAEYGGGQYRIAVMGPHPTVPNRLKQYDSIPLSLAGDPKWSRVPNALKGRDDDDSTTNRSTNGNPPPLPVAVPEATKLSEVALKMMQDTANSERDERRRVEEREERRRGDANAALNPIIEAERRRADDVLAAERRSSESERRMLSERLEEERKARESEREETRRRMHQMENRPQVSFADELEKLSHAGLLGNRGEDSSAIKAVLAQVLEKHRGEMEAIQQQNMVFIESLRSGHASEIQAIRDANRRELEAERDASRSREARIDERLQAEREERRRDQDRFREQVESRDQAWKDRMEQALEGQKTSWESRHQALTSTYEQRVLWLQQEVDRARVELTDTKLKTEEKGDLFAQLHRYREFSSALKEMSGGDSSSSGAAASGGGGIGLASDKSTPAWMEMLAESPIAEKIADRLFGGGQTQAVPTQQQPQFQEGQVVTTAQGEMVVVRNPNDGQLALAPRAAFEAHRRAMEQQQGARGGGGLLAGPQQQQRPARRKTVSVMPDLGAGLPKRRAPWEGGGEEPVITPRPVPPPTPRMVTRTAPVVEDDDEPMQLSSQQRQGLNMIAKMVHESVQSADDADDFVAKILNQYPAEIVKQIVLPYSIEDVARGIRQVEPNSAGATPAGQQFVREAFRKLRAALR